MNAGGTFRNGAAVFAPCIAVALLATLLSGQEARASAFQVNPVVVELTGEQRAATISVRNVSSDPVTIKAALFRWTQVAGEDVYTPTGDMIASPPIFTVSGLGTQLLRVGPRSAVPDGAYRVMLEEIPRTDVVRPGVAVTLRLNLPLYVERDPAARPNMSWAAWRERSGNVVLEGSNHGALHQQVIELDAIDPSGKAAVLSQHMGVILPDSAKRWTVGDQPTLKTGSTIKLRAKFAQGSSQADVVLQAR